MEANYPYAIKNQRGVRNKAPSRRLWIPELVLYGVRLLAKQFPGTVLDIEMDQSETVGCSNNFVFLFQEIIVTGGRAAKDNRPFSETEMLTISGNSWRYVASANLPIFLVDSAALTINNQVYLFGNLSIL